MSRCRDVSRALLIAFALALPGAGPSSGQAIIRPGDPALRPERIPVGTDTLAVLITPVGGTEQVFSTLVRRVERVSQSGETLFRETQQGLAHATDGVESDTLEVEAATLAFRRVVERTVVAPGATPRVRELSAGSGRLKAVVPVAFADEGLIAANSFFHVMATEAFIAALPIDERQTVRISVLRLPAVTVHDVGFAVEGREVLRTATGPVPCLVVRGANGATLWLAQDDGRLVRMRWTLASGATVWKLPVRDVAYR